MRKNCFGKETAFRTAIVLAIMIAAMITMAAITVYAEGEAGIKLDKKTLNLETGETAKLEATITPEGGNLDDVKWSSSSENVATVEKGKVKALNAGITEITASYKGAEAHCYVYVEKVKPLKSLGVQVAKGNVNQSVFGAEIFTVGFEDKTIKLRAVADPEGASTKVKWESDNENFKIDKDGVITLPDRIETAEDVTFTATSVHKDEEDGDAVSGSTEIYFLPKISGWEKPKNLLEVPRNGVFGKDSLQLRVLPLDYNNWRIMKYSAKPRAVLDVKTATDAENREFCELHPQKPGKVTVTAEDKFNPENKITTEIEVKGFYITDPAGTLNESSVEEGETLQLTAKGMEKDEITWKSDDKEIIELDEKTGIVKGLKSGVAKVEAEWDSDKDGKSEYTAEYEINVLKKNKAYPAKLYIPDPAEYYSNNHIYKDPEYKEIADDVEKYTEKGFKTKKGAFTSIADGSNKVYYLEYTNNDKLPFVALFNDKKVKAELKCGDKTESMYSGERTYAELRTGNNEVIVKVAPIDGKGEKTTYHYTIIRGYSKNDGMGNIEVLPQDRDTSLTLYNNKKEGSISPGFSAYSPQTDYTSFVFKDVTRVKVKLIPQDNYTGHVGYSSDGGNTWKEVQGIAETEDIEIPATNSAEVLFRCVSDAYYRKIKKEDPNADPFEKAKKTYSLTINRLDVSSEDLGLGNVKKIDLGEGLTWCSPKWSPGYTQSAAVVGHTTDVAKITYHVKPGTKLYNERVDDQHLVHSSGKDEEGNDLCTAETETPLQDQGSVRAQNIILVTGEGEKTATSRLSINLYKVGTTKGTLKGVHDSIVEYMCPGSQYTSGGNQGWGTYGIFPEKVNMGTGNWYSCISLGQFGGYMTLKYDKAITDDPKHPYGIDFTVFGNSNGGEGFSEPGNVLVSEDGKEWYSLAGSDHYDSTTMWDYSVTYKRNPKSKIADYEDNLGNAGSLGVGFAGTFYSMPDKKWYPLYNWKEGEDKAITFTGTRVFGMGVPENKGLENSSALMPAFGYVDTHVNGKTVAGTGESVNLYDVPVGNPYMEGYDGYGDGFDLKWAVDKDGNPVDSSKLKIHYVKVQTASFIGAGAIGEKSTEISCISRTSEEKEDFGKTEDPKITVGGKKVNISEDKDVYNVALDSDKSYDVNVDAAADANVYINNQRSRTRHYEGLPDKKILRVITQKGKSSPSIKYIHLTVKGSGDAVEDRARAEEVEGMFDTLPEEVTRENYSDIVKARAAYEELSNSVKAYVKSVEKLVQAEERGKGFALAEKIDKLSSEDNIKVEDVKALRKAYDALNDKQKKDVYTYNNLLIMENFIKLRDEMDKLKADRNRAITNPLAKPTDKTNPIVKSSAGDKSGNTNDNEKASAKKSLKVTGLKIKRVKRAFVLTWKKNGNAGKYEIAYKKKGSKSYKRLKTVKTARLKTGKLKKNKYYYFKVRAVGKVNGTTYYGNWTKAKKGKCR